MIFLLFVNMISFECVSFLVRERDGENGVDEEEMKKWEVA